MFTGFYIQPPCRQMLYIIYKSYECRILLLYLYEMVFVDKDGKVIVPNNISC